MNTSVIDNTFAALVLEVASLGMTPEELKAFRAAWDRIPAEKQSLYGAAFWTVCAARGVGTPPVQSVDTERGRIYWQAGYADKLIAAVDSFAECFCHGVEEDAVNKLQRISDWFGKNGIIQFAEPLANTLNEAKRRHNLGLELHAEEDAEARTHGGSKSSRK